MKTAILLIPNIGPLYNRHNYLELCIEKCRQENVQVLMPVFYDSHPVDDRAFFERMLPFVDYLYLFVNFGIDQLMLDMVDRAINKIEIRYRRVSTLDKVYSSTAEILNDVCQKLNISIEDIKSPNRKRELVEARQIYCRKAKESTKASLAVIGAEIKRDHATVMYAIKQAENVVEIKAIYEKYYGETPIEAPAMVPATLPADRKAEQAITRPVLPYRSMDPREQNIPNGKPFVHSLSTGGFYSGFSGYRPHST